MLFIDGYFTSQFKHGRPEEEDGKTGQLSPLPSIIEGTKIEYI